MCFRASNEAFVVRLTTCPPGGCGSGWCPAVRRGRRVCASTEGEGKRLDTRVQEHDFELPVGDRPWLADELVQPWLSHPAVALRVDVAAVRRARRLPIEQHPKP